MRNLRVSLVQRELVWENPNANRAGIAADLEAAKPDTDLVILPEMFTTGFSMAADKIAEDGASETLPWLRALAARHDAAVTGSLAVRDGAQIYNRLLWVTPDGEVSHYDKRHLFRMSGEHEHYAQGQQRLVLAWRDWRLCPMICYDLRFPVWTRNRGDYDALIFVANWPAKRRMHWRQLLIARAIENQACCLSVNRLGEDGNGLAYSGDSLAIAADGELLHDGGDAAGVFTVTLDAATLESYRNKFPCHRDADAFTLHPE